MYYFYKIDLHYLQGNFIPNTVFLVIYTILTPPKNIPKSEKKNFLTEIGSGRVKMSSNEN